MALVRHGRNKQIQQYDSYEARFKKSDQGMTLTRKPIPLPVTDPADTVQDKSLVPLPMKRDNTVSLAVERLKYKRFLLYVRPGTQASIEAMQLAVQVDSDVHIADVDQIPKAKLPPWLTGTPTLVDLVTKLGPYTGTDALDQLRQYVASEPLPISSVTKQYFKLGEAHDTEQDWGGFAPKHDLIMPDLSKDPRYESTGSITQQHVEALRRARGGTDSDIKLITGPKHKGQAKQIDWSDSKPMQAIQYF